MKASLFSVIVVATLTCHAAPALGAITLVPVTSGLSSPIFVGHAGDASNRLFIAEQTGYVRVLQPGASTPTLFLDIHLNVLVGSERGLLGLAFHPLYANNRRFFVYYTRPGDGAIVISEFKATVADRNVADPTETVLLTIPHPTNANHNGGMIAFGRDGYLYAAVGDGGSGNDPPNNAQNLNVLLGKMLRLDINPPAGSGVPYVSPPTNPFAGATPGRDEIFAFGLRNPWRFSFDRTTGQQWVGDVGQGAREEIDTPIVNGGNYGWRVYEGNSCTNVDPGLCNPSSYLFPITEYAHSSGRCSVTGGYVYRGSAGALPWGTYVYGDYCTGEIFGWNGGPQGLLLDTPLNISSFGEDEQGELYVVHVGGAISKIALSCAYALTPTAQGFSAAAGTGSVAVATAPRCECAAVSNAPWIHVPPSLVGFENAVRAVYAVPFSVDANTSATPRFGTITIGGQTFTVQQAGVGPGVGNIPFRPATSSPGSSPGSGGRSQPRRR